MFANVSRNEVLLKRDSLDTLPHMKQLTGLFEVELQSEGIVFQVTAEIMLPGMEESEFKRRVVEEWILHFGITAPGVREETLKYVKMRPVPEKPTDALKVPRGSDPVLIWKSVEE